MHLAHTSPRTARLLPRTPHSLPWPAAALHPCLSSPHLPSAPRIALQLHIGHVLGFPLSPKPLEP